MELLAIINQEKNNKNYYILFITFILTLLLMDVSYSRDLEERDYFASIKAIKANIRSGPGKQYPIKFTYKMKYIPVRITAKYDIWNEIEDFEGEKGWINQNLLSKKRTVISKSSQKFINVYLAATKKSRIILKLENTVITKLIGCKDDWCKIEINNKKGWVLKNKIWGVK